MKKPIVSGLSILGVLLTLVVIVNAIVYGGMKSIFPNASLTGSYPPAEQEERDKATPVKKVNADAEIPAQKAVDSIMSKDFPAVNGWQGGEANASTPASVFSWVCGNIEGKNIPHPMIANTKSYSKSGRKNTATIVAYAYGAGAGRTAVNKLRDQAAECSDGTAGITSYQGIGNDPNGGFSAYYVSGGKRTNVNVWAIGDVVLTVTSDSDSTLNQLSREYDFYAHGLLSPLCLSLKDKASDVTRNPYVSGDQYTGWNKGRVVNLDKNVSGINPGFITLDTPVSGKGYSLGSIPGEDKTVLVTSFPAPTIDYDTVTIPDHPLAPYPKILPKKVAKPKSKPETVKQPDVSRRVAERVKDSRGPGCGWAFTAQSAPVFDDRKEKRDADAREKRAQSEMQGDQARYYNEVSDYVLAYEEYARSVYDYKDYGRKVDKVRDKWNEIDDKRAAYRRKLDQYYQDIEDRKTFGERKDKAQKKYDEDVKICEDYDGQMQKYRDEYKKDEDRYNREVEEWRKKKEAEAPKPEPQPQPTGTETAPAPIEPERPDYSRATPPADEVAPPGQGLTKPDKPKECPVKRPAILDQAPPPAPTVPKKPDVELPYAWNDIPDEG